MTTAFSRLPDIERWMFKQALPFWAGIGRDPDGFGFVEQVSLDGRRINTGFTRMRVQARQTYVFCHALQLGWQGPALEAAQNGIEFITKYGWLSKGGWARRLTPHGEILDDTLEFYEQAFVLFAFGWYAKVTGDKTVIDLAHRTIDVLYQRLGGLPIGLYSQDPSSAHLLQNPHMHYLEAMIALYQATGEARFQEEADKIIALFRRHLFQSDKGVLVETFDHQWQPAQGLPGHVIEPGHHFEWVWLLYQYRETFGGDEIDTLAKQLFAFAHRYGSDAQGLVYDVILDDGCTHQPDHRTWPQTEALKAYIAMSEFAGEGHDLRIAQLVDILLDRYLNTNPRGIWIDHFDMALNPRVETVPASTFYHIFLAFAELQRWQKTREKLY